MAYIKAFIGARWRIGISITSESSARPEQDQPGV